MGNTPSSDPVPVDSLHAGVTDAVADGDTGQDESSEPDRRFTVHRELTFTLSYNVKGTAKPRLIRKFIKWLNKV